MKEMFALVVDGSKKGEMTFYEYSNSIAKQKNDLARTGIKTGSGLLTKVGLGWLISRIPFRTVKTKRVIVSRQEMALSLTRPRHRARAVPIPLRSEMVTELETWTPRTYRPRQEQQD